MPLHYVDVTASGHFGRNAMQKLIAAADQFQPSGGDAPRVRTERFGVMPFVHIITGAAISLFGFFGQVWILEALADIATGHTSWSAFSAELLTEILTIVMVVGAAVFAHGFSLMRRPLESELRARDARQPVVYFRSFNDDHRSVERRRWTWNIGMFPLPPLPMRVSERLEERMAPICARFGPFIGIGRPGDGSGAEGAARAYVADDVWKAKAHDLMDEAVIIVLVPGASDGLRWEITEIVERSLTPKLVFVFPPPMEKKAAHDAASRLASVREAYANTAWAHAIQAIDPSKLVALAFGASGAVVAAIAPDFKERRYQDALKICFYGVVSRGFDALDAPAQAS